MLVLSREKGESIMIGDDIAVMVVGVDRRGRVKLGVLAPKEVEVDRTEVRQRKIQGGDGK